VFLVFSLHQGFVGASDLIRTGEAAQILGCSRQHVVDLCDSGRLRFVRGGGSHRWVRHSDVLGLVSRPLTRQQEQSRWLHTAIAGYCVIDDAQWLDRASAQTLAFVARRLLGESVALVLAVREPSEDQTFDGLPELAVGGLDDEEARGLLSEVITGRLDGQVVDRIVSETRGNPLALLELPRAFSAGEMAGGFGATAKLPVSASIEQSFTRRLRDLPSETQRLLLLAAAEPTGDPVLLIRAG